MIALSTNIGNSVCSQFERDNIVCASILKRNVFTTNAVDNVDYNPSSRSAKDSFHETSITTTQHLEYAGDGDQREPYPFEKSKGYTLRKLPTDYAAIKPFVLKTNDIYVAKRSIFNDNEVSKITQFYARNLTFILCESLTKIIESMYLIPCFHHIE